MERFEIFFIIIASLLWIWWTVDSLADTHEAFTGIYRPSYYDWQITTVFWWIIHIGILCGLVDYLYNLLK